MTSLASRYIPAYNHGTNSLALCRRSFSTSVTRRKASSLSLDTGSSSENVEAAVTPCDDRDTSTLRMIIFGKPGAGKGTLTSRLVKRYDIVSLSTGDLLRQHIMQKTEVGKHAEEIVAQGNLLPDELMLKVVTSKLDHLKNTHWILDGFPRTVGQGELLDKHLSKQGTPLTLVVNLDVDDDIILSRIADRWVHLPSGRIYNLSYNAPKIPGKDDETGEPLTKRPDDNPEIFARRLKQFYASTSPLLAYYGSSSRARLVTLTGRTTDEVWPQLHSIVRTYFPKVHERARIIP